MDKHSVKVATNTTMDIYYDTDYITLITVNVIGLCAFVLNLLTLFPLVIMRDKLNNHLRFVVSMCAADALMCISILVYAWIGFYHVYAGTTYMATLSLLNNTIIAVDHYLAIVHPLRYPVLMSKKRSISIIVGIWVGSCVSLVALTTLTYKYYAEAEAAFLKVEATIFTILHVVALSVVLFCYGSMWKALRKSQNLVTSGELRTNYKFAVTSLWIVTTFTIFWTPFVVGTMIRVYRWSPIRIWMDTFLLCTPILNALSDPIIYAVRLKVVSDAMRRIYCGTIGTVCHRNQPETTANVHVPTLY